MADQTRQLRLSLDTGSEAELEEIEQLTRQLRAKYPEIYVILISGFREDELQNTRESENSRPHNYLTKPFSMRDLQGCLDSI